MTVARFRPLSEIEREIIDTLLSADIPGIQKLRDQLDGIGGKTTDRYGSLELKVASASSATEFDGPVVSAVQDDINTVPILGPYINFILFVKNGLLHELQIYKSDGQPILDRLQPKKFQVFHSLPKQS